MILYTVKNGVYYNLEDFKEDLSDLGENGFPNKIYINMTNRCSCSCTFCLRSLKEFNEHNSLWLKEEPSIELVKELFSKYDWSHVAEIIFCGFGEPTMRFDDVVEVARWLKVYIRIFRYVSIRMVYPIWCSENRQQADLQGFLIQFPSV